MKVRRKLMSPKIGRIDFCEPCGSVSTPAQRSQEMREATRDDIARIIGRL